MPRTLKEVLDHADELADRIEAREPGERRDAAALKQLRDQVVRRAEAERGVVDAVRGARADGHSWAAIAVMLGTSGEAARKRYGSLVDTSDRV